MQQKQQQQQQQPEMQQRRQQRREDMNTVVRQTYTLFQGLRNRTLSISPEARSRLESISWSEKAELLIREYRKYDGTLAKIRHEGGARVSDQFQRL